MTVQAASAALAADPGSFRDPAGRVFTADGRVFRTVAPCAWADLDAILAAGLLGHLVSTGRLVKSWPIAWDDAPSALFEVAGGPASNRLLEHERIPFVSYSYEWPFDLLRRAALHQLDLQIELLERGFTLSDASAFNIQFRGTKPVFIDVLSIRRYREGEYWAGYRQFCEQFLNPLLLTARTGVPHQAWCRGSGGAIAVEDLARVLPLRSRLSPKAFLHVVLHARMIARTRSAAQARGGGAGRGGRKPMSKAAHVWMVKGLRSWVAGLRWRRPGSTIWEDYERQASYSPEERDAKGAFVSRYVRDCGAPDLLELGCNTGLYAEVALQAGARRVVGFDFDQGALAAAVERADDRGLDFLPLWMDLANPTPEQGWRQRERRGLQERAHADGVLALALLHHLVIGGNVPLGDAVDLITGFGRTGVVEFVPKADPMVQVMLRDRPDIFPDYNAESFERELARSALIRRSQPVSQSGRTLYQFERRTA